MSTSKKRNVGIEIFRIAAIIIVICSHTELNYFDGGFNPYRLTLACMFGDSVAFFFMIAGFFFFQKGFLVQAKKVIFQIVVPAAMVMLLSQVFHEWLFHRQSLLGALSSFQIDWYAISSNLLAGKTGMELCPHMWYVFAYAGCVLWLPLMGFVCKEEPHCQKVRRCLILLNLAAVLVEGIQKLYILPAGAVTTFTLIPNSLAHMLIGYEIYQNRQRIEGNKKLRYIALAVFAGMNVIRWFAQYALYLQEPMDDYYMYWNTIFGFVCGTSMTIVFVSFQWKELKGAAAIKYIAARTYIIYLIHWAVMTKYNALGVREGLYDFFCGRGTSFVGELLYTVVYALLLYGTSLVIASVLHEVFVRGKGVLAWKRKRDYQEVH